MAITLLEARVKFTADKVWKSTQPGGKDYVSLKCETLDGKSPNGKDPVVYANVGSLEHSTLSAYRKGDPVQLAYDGKKYSVVGSGGEMKTAVQTLPPAQSTQMTAAPEKPTMESLVKKGLSGTELYYEIYSDLVLRGMPAEQAQPAASTVFIQLARNI
jgi:hypothetical protein